MIALLNLSVLGLSLVFHDKAQQGNLLLYFTDNNANLKTSKFIVRRSQVNNSKAPKILKVLLFLKIAKVFKVSKQLWI